MQDMLEIQRLFLALPGLFLVLRPDADISIVAASADYLRAMHADAGFFGQPLAALLQVRRREGDDDTLGALQASLQRVVATRQPETMPVQRYRVPVRAGADSGAAAEHHYWLPLNSPVLGADGEVQLIVHRVTEAAAKANQDAIGILDSITEGFYTLDREWRFDYVNREAGRILGRQPGELQGQVVWQAYPGLEGTEIERRYLRAMHQREKGSFTAYYAGHERWYEITVFPAAEGISVFFRDVSAQKAMEAERDALLAESEHQRRTYETVLDSTPDFMCVMDLDFRLIYANAALLKTWGVSDAAGKRLAELGYPAWQAEQHEREMRQVVQTGQPARGEVSFNGTGGTGLYDYIFAPVIGADGEVVAVAATARDITERQQMNQRLGESQRLEAIGTLAGGVAHDFNNMLAAILANVALAEQDLPPGSDTAARLRLAHRAADRARALVRQILTFGRRAPRLHQVQALQPLLDEAVALLHSTLPPTVRLALRPASAPVWARVDAAQFQQLVINLCTNAWQALRDERGHVRVSLLQVLLSPSQAAALDLAAGAYVRLLVADDGLGMDEAVRAHVFEPFFTTKPVGRGTGLGLAVVHGVVKESGGAILIKSRPGRGTAIAVYLPCWPEAAADATTAAPQPTTAISAKRAHVLYVDDDPIVSLTAQALLSRAGHAVTCVADGQTALQVLREASQDYALVVSDFNMPGMSGLALAGALRDAAPGLPLVIISGLVTDTLQAEAARLGVRRVLCKEHMFELLEGAVQEALQPAPGPPAQPQKG